MSADEAYALRNAVPKPASTDPAAILRRHDTAAWTELAGEVVVFRGQHATTYVLNAVAALVWKCLDGESSLEEILADVADVFEVDMAQVLDDFLPVVGEWIAGEIVTGERGVPSTEGDDRGESEAVAWHQLEAAPNVCGKAELGRWPHHVVVGIGGTAVTVASDRREVIDELQPWRVDRETQLIDYVLELDPPHAEGQRFLRRLPNLSHGCEPTFRVRDEASLLEIFWRAMASFSTPEDPRHLRVRLMPLIHGGRALLLPPEHGGAISVRAYAARSIVPLYTLASVIDVDTWTVRVDRPLLEGVPASPEAARSYPIAAWWLPTANPNADLTPGEALAYVLRWSSEVGEDEAGALLRLAAQAVEHQLPGLAPVTPDGFVEQLSPSLANEMRDELMTAIGECFETAPLEGNGR